MTLWSPRCADVCSGCFSTFVTRSDVYIKVLGLRAAKPSHLAEPGVHRDGIMGQVEAWKIAYATL